MPENRFYSEYDTEPYGGGRRPSDYRTAFQVDRDRVIHSAAFRKLQSKTQVYLSGEYDFYRTRLTHSIEVAQIGRSICQSLQAKSSFLEDGFHIDSDLVEACCLSHDLGHPPFGHGGERTLHRLFRPAGGFEGNAQTLRLLADTLYQGGGQQMGMSPTRAFMDGVMKYKSLFGEQESPENHFIYDEQLGQRDFVHAAIASLQGRQPAGAFRKLASIECQIMDWADDTAYCINDVVDGVRAGFITLQRLERWASRVGLDAENEPLFVALANDLRRDRLEPIFSKKIGQFISACDLVEVENPLSGYSNRYRFRLALASDVERQARFYKRVAVDLIFRSAPLQQMEYKGDRVLSAIWRAVGGCGGEGDRGLDLQILPEPTQGRAAGEADRAGMQRVIRDFLADLTDGQARRMYKRLFDPEYASIVDLD